LNEIRKLQIEDRLRNIFEKKKNIKIGRDIGIYEYFNG